MYLLLSEGVVIPTKSLVLILVIFVLLFVDCKALLSFLQRSIHPQYSMYGVYTTHSYSVYSRGPTFIFRGKSTNSELKPTK